MTVYTYKKIIERAKTCKKNVKNEYKLGISYKWGYYFAQAVLHPKKDIKKISINDCPSPEGTSINEKISQSNYKKLAENLVAYVNKHGRMPNYITYKSYKIRPKLFTEIFSRILVYYDANNKLSGSVTANSKVFSKPSSSTSNKSSSSSSNSGGCKSPYKALPYDSNSGCDHMGQNTGYWCGPSMVQKMLYELGITGISQSQLAKVAGTTTSGTDHQGLNTAVAWVAKKKGVKLTVNWYNLSDLSWKKLGEIMCAKNKSFGCHILYRDQWGHYEKPLSIYTDSSTVKVINSLGNKCTSSCYCGYVESRSFSTQKRYIGGISQKSVMVITKG